jgi:thiosulfate dehydrogenase
MRITNLVSLLVAVSIISFSQVSFAAEEVSSIARGGRLYDKWFAVIGAAKPKETHPAWPASNTKKKGNATHRCKSCHGWDMMGKDGAYASGSYKTGISGLKHMAGASNEKVIAVMKDSTHGYSGKMEDQDFTDLANFVTKGQFDIDAVIDRKSKKARGDTNKNPWEIIQKTQNGQPDEKMPAMRAFDLQVSVDILSYLQTLPKE